MNRLVVLIVLLSMSAVALGQGQPWDNCDRPLECPLRAACRSFQNASLFFPNTFLSDHAFWLPGLVVCPDLSSKFMFTATDLGVWERSVDGNGNYVATLKGTLENKIKPEAKLRIESCVFSGGHPAVPSTIKREYIGQVFSSDLTDSFIAENWIQYENIECTLVGLEFFAGLRVTLFRMVGSPPGQEGVGANGKNLNDGFSTWLEWTVDPSSPTVFGRACQVTHNRPADVHGDINIDLGFCTPCVCPPNAEVVNVNANCLGTHGYQFKTTVSGGSARVTFNPTSGSC